MLGGRFITVYVKLNILLEEFLAMNVSLNTSTDTFVISPDPPTFILKGIVSFGLMISSCPGVVMFTLVIVSVNKLDDILFAQLELSATLRLITFTPV